MTGASRHFATDGESGSLANTGADVARKKPLLVDALVSQ
jgi:hypothetical protein